MARWTLGWTLGWVILGCSAIPDSLGEGGGIVPLRTARALSKGLPIPIPDSPDEGAFTLPQPPPEPGAPQQASSFTPEDSALPQEPSWVPHLRPARPDVLEVAPKTGPPSRPPLA